MGNNGSDLSNGAGSSNGDSDPKKKELDTGKAVAAEGVAALAVWGLTKLASSSSSGLEEEYASGTPQKILEPNYGSFQANDGRLDRWRFPACGKLKMNVDGSVTDSRAVFGGRAGFGGVIRDESGSWIMGFYGRLEDCSSVEAELRGIYNGLQIIQGRRDFAKVSEIESDCEPAVNLIKSKTNTKLAIKEIVEECKVMLKMTGCTLKYISNKANRVADEMAERGRDQDNGFVTFRAPPDQKIANLLNADPKKKELDTGNAVAVAGVAVAAVGVAALAVWGLTKLASSSSSGLEEEYANNGRLDRWRFPACGKLKMNTDGSVTESQKGIGGPAGFGGVIRDESGSWIMGFYGRLKDCSSVKAELLAIHRGLQFIQRCDFGKVFEIESDCEPAVDLIKGKTQTKLPIKKMVEECNMMLQRTGCTLKYIGNKANRVADEMAERGRDQDNGFVTFRAPPGQKIANLFNADIESARSVLLR